MCVCVCVCVCVFVCVCEVTGLCLVHAFDLFFSLMARNLHIRPLELLFLVYVFLICLSVFYFLHKNISIELGDKNQPF